MTTVETPLPPATSPFASTSPVATPRNLGERAEAWLDWLGDRLNPILVKEARQALKSRQFTVTFALLLLFGAGWTALGVSLQMPAVFHAPSGPFMVVGYYIILAVPLMVIVPFAAFRSLAAEREDGTFDLLSITSLSSRQVVYGKLASAILQMIVYYSAIAPCIAFTYLLRGLDIITIGLMLWYLFLASTLLSSASLALATVTKERHWQVLLSVVLVAGLVMALWGWLLLMGEMFEEFVNRSPYDNRGFWLFNVALVMFHASTAVLFIFLAAGQISFASDNRSTPVRWVMFVQHAFWFGWVLYAMARGNWQEFYAIGSTIAMLYWWIAGSFLIGEKAELSPRVRRQLPQSFMGRMFLTWFNPGSGTGYFFTLVNAGVMLLTFAAVMNGADLLGVTVFGRLDSERVWRFTMSGWFLMAAYLGVGRLVVLAVRHRVPSGPVFSFLLQVVLVTFGVLVPLVVQLSAFGAQDLDYTPLQMTNPFWTLAEMLFEQNSYYSDLWLVCAIIAIAGGGLMLLHFVLTIREVEQTRLLAPQRVLEEDAATLAARTPAKRKNPWEEV